MMLTDQPVGMQRTLLRDVATLELIGTKDLMATHVMFFDDGTG